MAGNIRQVGPTGLKKNGISIRAFLTMVYMDDVRFLFDVDPMTDERM